MSSVLTLSQEKDGRSSRGVTGASSSVRPQRKASFPVRISGRTSRRRTCVLRLPSRLESLPPSVVRRGAWQ